MHFVTGARVANAHAVVLAGQQGEDPTEVLLPASAPAATGEPIAAPVLLKAPRCAIPSGCGAVADGAPLQTYTSATVSPDGSHLAVVFRDVIASTSVLEVIDTVDGVVLDDVADGAWPSWSPDGTQLAFAAPAGVAVFDVQTGEVSTVAADTTLVGPPLWTRPTTLVLSTAAPSDGTSRRRPRWSW